MPSLNSQSLFTTYILAMFTVRCALRMKAEGFTSSFARASRRFRATIKEETGHQTGKEPAMFDKSEEEMIERWRKHQSTASRLSVAEEIRNLIHTSSSHGVLSTNSLQYPGYPVGSVVAFVLDEDGLPFFSLSTMSAHTRELLADNRASLVVMAHDFKTIAEGRISILGTISKVLDEASKSKLRERYLERHKDSYWIDFGDFSFFKMTNVEMVRYVGGFARAGSATGAEFLAAKVDPLIGFATPVMKHMNDDHADSLITMVQHYVGVPVSEASMVALDRLGFTVRAKLAFGDRDFDRIRVPFIREVSERKAVREVIVEMSQIASAALEKESN